MNLLQEEALWWIMGKDVEDQISLERERMKYTILAGNIQLWQQLYADEKDEIPDDEIEWIKPESAEDIEAMLSVLSAGEANESGS